MKKLFFVLFVIVFNLYAQQFFITKKEPIDLTKQNGYDICEANATNKARVSAINQYFGCSVNDYVKQKVFIKFDGHRKRELTLQECKIESIFSVSSVFFDQHKYLLGKYAPLCRGYDISLIEQKQKWYSFELGVYRGNSGTQNKLELKSNQRKIYYRYSDIAMYGFNFSSIYKTFPSQYIGVSFFSAMSFETYANNISEETKIRNDGDPLILRYGTTLFYGYRYHLQTEFKIGMEYFVDTIKRNYSNYSYSIKFKAFTINFGVGYYIFSNIKIWMEMPLDQRLKLGVSYVF